MPLKSKIPESEVLIWWQDYQRLRSFTKVGALHGRSQGTIHTRLARAGFIQPVRGPREMPAEMVEALVAEYGRTKSLQKTAETFKRTRQTVWEVLHRRGLTLPPKPVSPKALIHNGEKFCPDRQGYYRSTRYAARKLGGHRLLHRVVWEEAHGPIPPGMIIIFRDRDSLNCDLDNLRCVTRREARKLVKSGNGWMKFREEHDRRFAELQAALESGDADAIARASAEYDALTPPDTHSPERRAKHSAAMRERWAKIPKAERRKIARKIGLKRTARRHAQIGTSLERLVEA